MHQPGVGGHCAVDVATIKRELSEWLYPELAGVVQLGPFKGMTLLQEVAWSHTYLPPLLLGCYEEELHGVIEQQIQRLTTIAKPRIGIIGCAEGYYAVGFKVRVPHAEVYALDSSGSCLDICHRTAARNGVSLASGTSTLTYLDVDFILMDVEGAEVEYLKPEVYPVLRNAHILVELHDHPCISEKQVTEELVERFRSSHTITLLFQGPRNPFKHVQLWAMSSDYQWLAVSEGRPCVMWWLMMEPRGRLVS